MTPILIFAAVYAALFVGAALEYFSQKGVPPMADPVTPPAPPTLSPAAQALLAQAFTDEAAAAQADTVVVQDQQTLAAAQATVNTDLAGQAAAHAQSSASAMAALLQIAAELGIQLPAPPPTPPAPPAPVGAALRFRAALRR